MAEAATEERGAPARSSGFSLAKKWGPLPVWAWGLIGGGGLGVVYFLWKRKSASASTATAAAGTTTGVTANCYDQNGNQVPCQGYTAASQYDTLLGAIQGLYGGGTAAAGTGTGTGTGTSGTGTGTGGGTGGPPPPPATVKVPNLVGMQQSLAYAALKASGLRAAGPPAQPGKTLHVVTQSPGGGTSVPKGSTVSFTSAVSTAPRPPAGGGSAKAPATPTGVHVTSVGSNNVGLAWNKVAGANSYVVRTTYQSRLVSQHTTRGTTLKVTGLGADHTYTFHVKACDAHGCSTETGGPVQKTNR